MVRYNIIMSMESNSVGSERLRRAIERNRVKRARQEGSRSERLQSRLGRRSSAVTPAAGRHSMMGTGRTVAKPPSAPHLTPRRPEPAREGLVAPASATTKEIRSPRISRFLSGLWEYLLRLTWLFCGVLILRLIFTNGGVVDFYAKKERLELKEKELFSIKSENQEIVEEIDKIKNSSEYQKQLVRSHLEFIAPDEFLILFAKEGDGKGP